jgi:thiamine biosynthesis protein ThiS
VNLQVNGEPREVADGASLGDLLRSLNLTPGRLACERNGEIVKRADYDATPLAAGDVVEIVQMIGGG